VLKPTRLKFAWDFYNENGKILQINY